MAVLPIVTMGDPVLRARAREVTAGELASPRIQGLIDCAISIATARRATICGSA